MGYFLNFEDTFKRKLGRVFKISSTVLFNAGVILLFGIVLFCTGIYNFSSFTHRQIIDELLKLLLPVSSSYWWFATSYIIIYLILTSLSGLQHISKKTLKSIISVMFFIFVIRIVGNGLYYIFDYMMVALIGYYLRRYDEKSTINKGKIIILGILSFATTTTLKCLFYYVKLNSMGGIFSPAARIGEHFSEVFALIFAICLLRLFSAIPAKTSNIINTISASTFSCYIFHQNIIFYSFFIDHLGLVRKAYYSGMFIIILALLLICLYSISLLLDKLRLKCTSKIWTKICRSIDGGYSSTAE